MRETKIERDACDLIWRRLGIVGAKLRIAGERGWPDRLFLLPGGCPLFVEFKRPGEDLRPDQVRIRERLRRNGYWVESCHDAYDALSLVLRYLNQAKLSKAQQIALKKLIVEE